jgi:hypothetical protein
MNDPRGPRRFSKYRDGVSLQEHLEKIINLRFDAIEKAIKEARRVMEHRMEGFPQQFVQRGETDTALTELKLKVDQLMEVKNQMVGKASNNFVVVSIVISLAVLGLTMLRHFRF